MGKTAAEKRYDYAQFPCLSYFFARENCFAPEKTYFLAVFAKIARRRIDILQAQAWRKEQKRRFSGLLRFNSRQATLLL